MDNVVSKGERNAPETRLVTITSHTFPLRVREIIFAVCSFVHSFVHLFVRLVNRSNGKHSIDRELQHDVHLFTAKYWRYWEQFMIRVSNFFFFFTASASLFSVEIIAGWIESGLSLFRRKLSRPRNFCMNDNGTDRKYKIFVESSSFVLLHLRRICYFEFIKRKILLLLLARARQILCKVKVI